MLPSLRDWKSWSAGERASYIAQILVPVSLLVTVIFSYLSWSEARQATALQREMFIAQNSPVMELQSALMTTFDYPAAKPAIDLTFSNTGGSAAQSICIEIQDQFQKKLQRTCEADDRDGKISVPKGSYFSFLMVLDRTLMGDLDHADRVEVILPGKEFDKCKFYGIVFFIAMDFTDVWGKKNRTVREIIVCDDHSRSGAVTK